MRILMTGATGFIGKPLARELASRGHGIVALARDPVRARETLSIECEAHAWDAERSPAPSAALAGVEAVVNLAGDSVGHGRWTAEKKKRILDSRVSGTRQLIEGFRREGTAPKSFVSASAIGFYGNRGDAILDETASGGEGFLAQVVRAWETESTRAAELGARTVLLRFGMVLGRQGDRPGGALEQLTPIFRAGAGGRVGSGRQWMSWIHLHDLVAMLVRAVEDPAWKGIYNAVAPNPVTNEEFTRRLGERLHRPTLLPVPAFALRALLGEKSELVLDSQRVQPRAARDQRFGWKFERLDLALADLFP